jgi:hypothetical protein
MKPPYTATPSKIREMARTMEDAAREVERANEGRAFWARQARFLCYTRNDLIRDRNDLLGILERVQNLIHAQQPEPSNQWSQLKNEIDAALQKER